MTTSRVEGSHAALKTWIPTSRLDLSAVYERIRRHVNTQANKCLLQREREKERQLIQLRGHGMFDVVHNQISHYGLNIAFSEYKKAINGVSNNISCPYVLQVNHGLPCSHQFAKLLAHQAEAGITSRLRVEEFNEFWILDKKANQRAIGVDVRSPRLRSRHQRAKSNKRMPSQFEVTNNSIGREMSKRRCSRCKQYSNHNKSTCPLRRQGQQQAPPVPTEVPPPVLSQQSSARHIPQVPTEKSPASNAQQAPDARKSTDPALHRFLANILMRNQLAQS